MGCTFDPSGVSIWGGLRAAAEAGVGIGSVGGGVYATGIDCIQ